MDCAQNTVLKMSQDYEFAWLELNRRLHKIEQNGGGLPGVFRELEAHQRQTGFIKDELEDIAHYVFLHPEDKSRTFRVQYNPKRALRLNGIGLKNPPPGIAVNNNGCFLCRDNIEWQQQGAELGYEIQVNGDNYFAWMNPFPLSPAHVVISSVAHMTQEWSLHDEGELDIDHLLLALVELANQLPGYIGFYNGVGAGASIPGHMHLQFLRRPEDDSQYPLERAAHDLTRIDGTDHVRDYPLDVVVWRGSSRAVVEQAVEWLSIWAQRNQPRLNNLAANLIAMSEPSSNEVSLYFTPRERDRSWSGGMSDLIGGLEVMGEFVFTKEEEKDHLEQGIVNYFSLEKILTDIYTPFFSD